MKLIHYSHQTVPEVFAREQEPNPAYGRFVRKPAGLWVSDEDSYSWKQWCTDAPFEIGSLAYAVTLKRSHDVLIVGDHIQLEQFHERFSRTNEAPEGIEGLTALRGITDRWIDWHAVAEQWQGIIISPYRWDKRMEDEYLWYYGWDCASGCIWNPDAIDRIELEP